jgi:hypothetical protein
VLGCKARTADCIGRMPLRGHCADIKASRNLRPSFTTAQALKVKSLAAWRQLTTCDEGKVVEIGTYKHLGRDVSELVCML